MVDEKIIGRVFEIIEKKEKELIDLITKFISIKSAWGHEAEAQTFVIERFKDLGLKVDAWEPEVDKLRKHWAYEGDSDAFVQYGYKDRQNVVGIVEGKGNGRSVIFFTHVDTMPAEPVSDWHYDPWGRDAHNGRLYGRGTHDMKSGLPCIITAISSILDAKVNLKGKVLITSAIDEQVHGSGGALDTLIRGYTGDAAICPHPGQGLNKLIIAKAGMCVFKIRVVGKTAHSSRAHNGVSAIEKMFTVFNELKKLDIARQEKIRYSLFEKTGNKPTTLNIGIMKAGDRVHTVPGWAEIEGRVSLIPGEKIRDIDTQISDAIQKSRDSDQWLKENPPEIEWKFRTEGHETRMEEPIVQTVLKTIQDITHVRPELVGSPIHGDARFYAKFGIPYLSFGPLAGNAMAPDEYVELKELIPFTKIIALTIMNWCGIQGG